MSGFRPNPGYLPPDAIGKRVRVILVNGEQHDWAADGRPNAPGCDWTPAEQWLPTLRPWAISEYQVL